jgi:hypothetical protein
MTDCESAPPKVDPDAIDALIDWALTQDFGPALVPTPSRVFGTKLGSATSTRHRARLRCTSRSRAMATPRIAVEVVFPLKDYTEPQLILACAIQQALERGKLVLTERPWKA